MGYIGGIFFSVVCGVGKLEVIWKFDGVMDG